MFFLDTPLKSLIDNYINTMTGLVEHQPLTIQGDC
jgi:hypothetical protein